MTLFLLLVKTGVVTGLLYGLFAYGLSLILAVNKVFHVAQGATFVVSAYIFYALSSTSGIPQWVAVIGAFVGAGLLGALMQILLYRPLARRGADPMVVLVASLLTVSFVQYCIELIFGATVLSVPVPAWFNTSWTLGGVQFSPYDIGVVVVSLVLFAGMHWFLVKTRPGLEFRAVGDNPERASALAINLNRVFMRSIILGSMLVVPAAILLSLQAPIQSSMGFDLLLKAVIALTIGGMGRMSGALIGGLMVGLVEALPPFWLPTEWGEFTLYIVAFAFVLVRPNGLLGGRPKNRMPALLRAIGVGSTRRQEMEVPSTSAAPESAPQTTGVHS
ncbi:amino acid/amide ABC transporter membrane protein 1, HAAT family [Nakamurella panacisegetis]|uniref:Amino acid/amide ABC transporter membrane protein 1, HAAT family n=1 Tax=Nakamurella panacisegetis TaxID=1090615 RepID=A0A1H0LAE2_9ACTN|nr:branched-chain amino acid ABC transporter permease [Nakamurella panacisegetis]SDO64973.1 amino acid/amide ABC transporter membrane protein 1, HAAT family [Nakamurella panacisegetis]